MKNLFRLFKKKNKPFKKIKGLKTNMLKLIKSHEVVFSPENKEARVIRKSNSKTILLLKEFKEKTNGDIYFEYYSPRIDLNYKIYLNKNNFKKWIFYRLYFNYYMYQYGISEILDYSYDMEKLEEKVHNHYHKSKFEKVKFKRVYNKKYLL